jgi:hypothetical protein
VENHADPGARLWPQGSGVRIPSLTLSLSMGSILGIGRHAGHDGRSYAGQLLDGLLKIGIADNGMASVATVASMPRDLGRHRSGDSRPLRIPDRYPSEVVAQHTGTAGLLTCRLPGLVEILNPLSLMPPAEMGKHIRANLPYMPL